MNKYSILNARLDTAGAKRQQLQMRSNHNVGIAMDTPSGLLVPVIKFVNARSLADMASEIARLWQLGQSRKHTNEDLSVGIIMMSNIGNIVGEVVVRVIVEG